MCKFLKGYFKINPNDTKYRQNYSKFQSPMTLKGYKKE